MTEDDSKFGRAANFLKSNFSRFFARSNEDSEGTVTKSLLPLEVFYESSQELKRVVRSLTVEDDGLEASEKIEILHSIQCVVLNSLEQVYADVNDSRSDRTYRLKFPENVREQMDSNFWETLLFAAELLADGRSIARREDVSNLLRPLAVALCDAFETLTRVLRVQAKKKPDAYPQHLRDCLVHFESTWIKFENLYIRAIAPCSTTEEFEHKQEMTVIFSEALMHGLHSHFLTQTMIDECDPQAMIAIPRLAVVFAAYRDVESSSLLLPYESSLKNIRKELDLLGTEELETLQLKLTNMEMAQDLEGNVHNLYIEIANVSDRLQQGEHAKEYRDIMSTLFLMHSCADEDLVHSSFESLNEEEIIQRRKSVIALELISQENLESVKESMENFKNSLNHASNSVNEIGSYSPRMSIKPPQRSFSVS